MRHNVQFQKTLLSTCIINKESQSPGSGGGGGQGGGMKLFWSFRWVGGGS